MEIIVGTYENFILGFSYPDLKPTFTNKNHNSFVTCLAINQKLGLLASGSADENISLLNLKTRKEMGNLFGHNDRVTFVGFTSKNELYSTSMDGRIAKWEYILSEQVDNKDSKAGMKRKKSKNKTWELTNSILPNTNKNEKNKMRYNTAALHPSGNLLIASNKGENNRDYNINFVSLLNQGSIIQQKKMRGTKAATQIGSKPTVDLCNHIAFLKETENSSNFVAVCNKNIIRCFKDGSESWKYQKSKLDVIHDVTVFDDGSKLICVGETTGAENGRRVRYGSVEIIDLNSDEEENGSRSLYFKCLYPDGRIKAVSAIESNDDQTHFVFGDSNGKISIYNWECLELDKIKEVDCKGRITCMAIKEN